MPKRVLSTESQQEKRAEATWSILWRGARGQGIAAGSHYWVLYGLGAIVGPLITGHLGDKSGFGPALRAAFLVEAAVLLPIVGTAPVSLIVSSVVIGAFAPGFVPLALGCIHERVPRGAEQQRATWSATPPPALLCSRRPPPTPSPGSMRTPAAMIWSCSTSAPPPWCWRGPLISPLGSGAAEHPPEIERGFAGQSWPTFRQALSLGGPVRKGERGVTVVYADRFVPTDERQHARETGDEAQAIPFLKRFTVHGPGHRERLIRHQGASY